MVNLTGKKKKFDKKANYNGQFVLARNKEKWKEIVQSVVWRARNNGSEWKKRL